MVAFVKIYVFEAAAGLKCSLVFSNPEFKKMRELDSHNEDIKDVSLKSYQTEFL